MQRALEDKGELANERSVAEFRTAQSSIDDMHERKRRFHDILRKAEISNVPGKIELPFVDGEITVTCLGHTVTAKPRPVMNGNECFIEYDFQTDFKGKTLSIWRSYLTCHGVVCARPSHEDGNRICDYDNQYVGRHIITQVAMALLKSPVFAPAEDNPTKGWRRRGWWNFYDGSYAQGEGGSLKANVRLTAPPGLMLVTGAAAGQESSNDI